MIMFFQENAFENVVSEMAAIFFPASMCWVYLEQFSTQRVEMQALHYLCFPGAIFHIVSGGDKVDTVSYLFDITVDQMTNMQHMFISMV